MRATIGGSDKGNFIGGALAWDVLRLTATHESSLPTCIDMSGAVHLKPYALACLAALGARAGRETELILPRDSGCRSHILRLGLHRWFTCDANEPPRRDTNVPIEQLQGNHLSDFAWQAMNIWEKSVPNFAANLRASLENHLDELILNALTHSDSPVGCLVAGQAFSFQDTLEVAVVDLGQTIRGHLTRNAQYRFLPDDRQAILLATTEGVTGTPPKQTNKWNEPNSGAGLSELRSYCESGWGELTILSGDACVTFREGHEPAERRVHQAFKGCLVNVRFFGAGRLPAAATDQIIW